MLLATKLSPPPLRPSRVSRPHLMNRLEAGLRQGSRLTLISAPAGYGKTSLVSEWIADSRLKIEDIRTQNTKIREPNPQSSFQNLQFCWLSLDEGDNDPSQFLRYLIAALQHAGESIGRVLEAVLDSPQPPPLGSMIPSLINDVAAHPAMAVLILDDYHAITDQSVHAALEFILDHQPPNLHLVLLTRADPPLPIARLRARGQLTELRAADLRFTTDEAAAFLNQVMGLDLHLQDVRALEQRVEGWAAGIQLAAIALESLSKTSGTGKDTTEVEAFIRSFTGGHHYVVEYLVEEVLRRQSEDIQNFLLRTSLLERMCGPLCDAILLPDDFRLQNSQPSTILQQSTVSNSQSILEYLDHNNLFLTPLDSAHTWYRYHPLFAEVLRARLKGQVSADEITAIHRRASVWFWENGMLDEAIEHALSARDYDQAATFLESSAKGTMLHGRPTALLRWSERLPAEWLRSRPRLRIYHAWALFLSGKFSLGQEQLQDVYHSLPRSPETQALRGELASLLAIAATIDQPPAVIQELAQEALDNLPDDDLASRARALRGMGVALGYLGETERCLDYYQQARQLALASGNIFLASNIIETISSMYLHLGRLRLAARTCQELVELGSPSGSSPLPFTGNGFLGLAVVSLEQDNLESAGRYLDQAMELTLQGGIGYNLLESWCVMARLRQAQDDLPGAHQALQEAEQVNQSVQSFGSRVLLAAHQVRFWLAQGDFQQAQRWAFDDEESTTPKISLVNLPLVVREVHLVTQARLWLAQGEYEKVLEIAAGLLPKAEAGGRMARVLEISLLKALALYARGDLPAALESLEHALELAEQEGYVRLFLEAGEPAHSLLRVASSRLKGEVNRTTAGKLLRAFESLHPAKLQPSKLQPSELIEPLTDRELEVLHLLAAGNSNQEIAAHMVVSLNTVKKHSSNLYGKLGVTSRTQAIARARELGLL